MKNHLSTSKVLYAPLKLIIFGLIFFVSCVVSAESQNYKQEKQRKATIRSCPSISNVNQRKLCFEEKKRRVARRRALNEILAIGPDGGSTQGGASDCAATAESDCANTLDEVGTLEWDGEVCVWTCIAIAPPPSP